MRPERERLGGGFTRVPPAGFDVIPSLDLLRGRVVRLTRGDFATANDYGTPDEVLQRWNVPSSSRLHIVDLEGSRQGKVVELDTIRPLLSRGFRVQVGGGIRSIDDARRLIAAGVERVVIGTVTADSPDLLRAIANAVGPERIIAAVDLRERRIRTSGWEQESAADVATVFRTLRDLGVAEALVTDINVDGTMRGPAFGLYRDLAKFDVPIIASGGIGTAGDVEVLAGISGLSGAVIGRALHEERFTLNEVQDQAKRRGIPRRIVPCLDIQGGRVVKGVRFEALRDAGDPVECAERYEAEGADELVVLDISATEEDRNASREIVRAISSRLFIPLTVGGGVRSVEDFRELLRAGADRVAINSAAVERPQLIAECAREFGVQAVVVAVDAMRRRPDAQSSSFLTEEAPGDWVIRTRSGRVTQPIEAVAWCLRAEELGAGEILMTSIDRDGTAEGFDIELLRAITSRLKIGVIASGGAGKLEHFLEGIERGGARAVLAASLFHDRKLAIGDLKSYLKNEGVEVR